MADLTITVPDPAVPRVRTAVGSIQNLGRDATVDEVRQFLVDTLTEFVIREETRAAQVAAISGITDLGATI